MSEKHSRSEIENALTGNPKRNPSNRKSDNVERQIDSLTARRQQVIGGDLTGVSRRRQSNTLWNWFTGINLVNWVASVIVLMIVAVFFWPQPSNNTIKEVSEKQALSESNTYYDEARVDEPEIAPIEQSFTRPSDIDRASDFRALDQREREINSLLAKAEQHIAKGEYTQPNSENALQSYRKILSLQSNNTKARQGIEYINGRYLNLGYQALEENSLNKANASLQKLALINADSFEHSELEEAITAWTSKRQIDKFLVSASQAFNDDKMILPARGNALFYYQQILELDADNEVAKGGINRIINHFVSKANAAINAGQVNAANGYLTTIGVIDGKHPSISNIENRIAQIDDQKAPTSVASLPARQNSASAGNTQNDQRQATSVKTPPKEAREQEAFDRQYLQRGLDAYYKGEYESAAALLQPLADKGVSRAQFRIAYMHFLGRGFKRDKVEADRIIRAALPAIQKFADEGRGWAQSDVGSLYEDGLVLPRDYGEAIYWYRSAAEQGYPGAQTNLGIMYARGLGVGTSRKTAIEWFQRAAKQGDIAARRNLESLGIKP